MSGRCELLLRADLSHGAPSVAAEYWAFDIGGLHPAGRRGPTDRERSGDGDRGAADGERRISINQAPVEQTT